MLSREVWEGQRRQICRVLELEGRVRRWGAEASIPLLGLVFCKERSECCMVCVCVCARVRVCVWVDVDVDEM